MLYCIHKTNRGEDVYYCTDTGAFIPDFIDAVPTCFAIIEEAQVLADYLCRTNIPCSVKPYMSLKSTPG